jgi:hypothetical protein
LGISVLEAGIVDFIFLGEVGPVVLEFLLLSLFVLGSQHGEVGFGVAFQLGVFFFDVEFVVA